MKSLPIPVTRARHDFSEMVAQARQGQRIRLTRHGKNVAWIVGPGDREALSKTGGKRSRSGKR